MSFSGPTIFLQLRPFYDPTDVQGPGEGVRNMEAVDIFNMSAINIMQR